MVLYQEWSAYRAFPFDFKKGDSWDRLLHQGVHLLEKFAREDRVRTATPQLNLQVKIIRSLAGDHQFVAYLDVLGSLDGTPCVLDRMTTTSRYRH